MKPRKSRSLGPSTRPGSTGAGLGPARDIEFVYTGLRTGEKLTQELWTGNEDVEPTAEERVLVIRRPEAEAASLIRLPAQMETLERLATAGDVEHLIRTLRRVVPEYGPAGTAYTE